MSTDDPYLNYSVILLNGINYIDVSDRRWPYGIPCRIFISEDVWKYWILEGHFGTADIATPGERLGFLLHSLSHEWEWRREQNLLDASRRYIWSIGSDPRNQEAMNISLTAGEPELLGEMWLPTNEDDWILTISPGICLDHCLDHLERKEEHNPER